MRNSQRYILTYWDLFTIREGTLCGAEAEVAILDGGVEVDRMKFTGKYQGEDGYRRAYSGKPGLTAELVFGPGRIQFAAEDLGVTLEA
ncbi:hypothetical protein F2A37_16360 [Pseudomonas chlororaphis]|uniref:hypothetical protein n=1 Tax=Pseudomonas chlororaphis TaxID=587753 RepID=UPI001232E101|nr:hypothetical protein [Pseudomonas chlororaphis]KAA5842240.1 hypothetical protein F2A37_16360 [Pseudomonas chlororaphis]